MENDAVFAVEANIGAQLSQTDPPLYRSSHTGHDLLTSAYGGIEIHKPVDYEETPLLSRDPDRTYSEGQTTSEPAWSGERDFEGKPWWNRPSVFWLLPPFSIFALAFGGSVVPRISLMLNLICQDYLSDRSQKDPTFTFMPIIMGADNPQCQIPEVQARVSTFTLYIMVIAGLLSAFASPKLGAFSDRYGRRKVIAFSTSGMLITEIITILAATYPETMSYRWMLLGSAFDGICGSFTAAMAIVNAYASDFTAPARRNVTFAYLHGALFSGIALGPVLAGLVIKATGKIINVFYIALVFHFCFLLFMAFVIPESLSKERQKVAREKHAIITEGQTSTRSWISGPDGLNIFAPLAILYPTSEGSNRAVRRNLIFLAAVDTTMFGVAMGSITVVLIYSSYMFGWGPIESGIFVSIVNISRVFCLLVLLPFATYFVRGRTGSLPQRNSGSDNFDLTIIRTAILFDMIGYIGYASVRTGPLLILSGVITAAGGMGSPTLQSALTKHIPPDRIGQLLGAMGCLHALARVVAPTIFNGIYSLTVGKFTQTVFVCLGSTFGIAFVLSLFIKPHVYYDEPETPARHEGYDGSEGETRAYQA